MRRLELICRDQICPLEARRDLAYARSEIKVPLLYRQADLYLELPIDMNRAWAAPELLPPLMRLLSNPIVQAYLRRAVVSALSRRFSA